MRLKLGEDGPEDAHRCVRNSAKIEQNIREMDRFECKYDARKLVYRA